MFEKGDDIIFLKPTLATIHNISNQRFDNIKYFSMVSVLKKAHLNISNHNIHKPDKVTHQ